MHMSDLKDRRQRAITDLIRADALSNQEELAERLTSLGFAVTQATISRDLEQIGAVKVRRGGQLSYALPDQVQGSAGPALAAVLRDFVRSIDSAGNLVIIRTPPGSAHLVGVALDQSGIPEIVGTICGDDTIFIACPGPSDVAALSRKLRAQ
jgi:transcriptional regulator of arginine metabolism